MSAISNRAMGVIAGAAYEHGPGIVQAAIAAALPSDAGAPSARVLDLEREAARHLTLALVERERALTGEAEALEELARSELRTALHARNLGALERHAEQAAQLRAQLVGLAFTALKTAPVLLAAVG